MRRGRALLLFGLGGAATTTAVILAGSGFGAGGAPTVASAAGDPVIAAVGDIACDPGSGSYLGGAGTTSECRQRYTSDLAVGAGLTAVLGLGDLQYEDGTWLKFTQSYDASWGRVKSITYPAPGNHEYDSPGAAGYYDYFGARAGDRAKGYYSFDIGAWHLIALNSECSAVGGCGPGSPQLAWLIQDLQSHASSACTLAFWHHPRFSSGQHGSDATYHAFWQALYDHDADLVLVGHDHNYERFTPQTPAGVADPVRGIRQFVVGTGGKSLRPFATAAANSEVRESATFGILKLTLHPTSYDWAFVPEAGRTFTDAGSGTCHAPPAPTAAFSGSPTSGTAPLAVTFSDQSTGSPTSWAWDFDGDGTVDSTLQNPSFSYSTAGTYTVRLTASNAHGSDDEVKTGYVSVLAPPPTAAFSGSPRSGTAPLTVAFVDESAGSATSWAWDFDGNGTVDSTLRNPSFTYTSAGTYTVSLNASNAAATDSEVKTAYVSVAAPPRPTAAFSGSPTSGTAPLTVAFSDQSTGSPTSWAWDFDGDGTVDSTLQNPSFTYSTAGTYTVRLTASNTHGSDLEVKVGYVAVDAASGPAPQPQPQPQPQPGTAPTARFTASPAEGVAPLTVRFTDSSSSAPTSWSWDFQDDGTADSAEGSPSFTYTAPGTYVVRLTVSNAHGASSAVERVLVRPAPKVTTRSLAPRADGYVGVGRARVLLVGGTRGRDRSYLTFVLGVRGAVSQASLRLYVSEGSASQVTVQRCAAGWTEGQLGKGTKPRLLGRPLARGRPRHRGRWLELRLPLLALPANGPFCLALLASGSDPAAFGSRESRTPPRLVLRTS